VAQALVAWDERIARARVLAAADAPGSKILAFYAGLAAFQRSLAERASPPAPAASPFADSVDLDAAVRAMPAWLSWLRAHAPAPLARAAAECEPTPPSDWRGLMRRTLTRDAGDAPADPAALGFIVEAILQPFAEQAAMAWRAGAPSGLSQRTSRCPACGGPPVVGALREEGHGAKRTLVCALCLTEWDYLRVHCPACGANRFDALPVYTADTPAHVRIDACDECHAYLKTVDLTKDGLAVPIVDDLASVPLDLWAREHGYHRARPSLLRL
jgi:FdhE protein